MFPLKTILNIGGKILDRVLPDPQAKAAKAPGKTGQRARLAQTLKGLKK